MSKEASNFELPKNIDRYLAALSKLPPLHTTQASSSPDSCDRARNEPPGYGYRRLMLLPS